MAGFPMFSKGFPEYQRILQNHQELKIFFIFLDAIDL